LRGFIGFTGVDKGLTNQEREILVKIDMAFLQATKHNKQAAASSEASTALKSIGGRKKPGLGGPQASRGDP
jgi:hypothetical protein